MNKKEVKTDEEIWDEVLNSDNGKDLLRQLAHNAKVEAATGDLSDMFADEDNTQKNLKTKNNK